MTEAELIEKAVRREWLTQMAKSWNYSDIGLQSSYATTLKQKRTQVVKNVWRLFWHEVKKILTSNLEVDTIFFGSFRQKQTEVVYSSSQLAGQKPDLG